MEDFATNKLGENGLNRWCVKISDRVRIQFILTHKKNKAKGIGNRKTD